MNLGNKIKWVLGILMVFILIVSTNLIDKKNFTRIKDSVETIYEDRLIADDLLFEMSRSIQLRQLAVANSDISFFSKKSETENKKINEYISRYEKTKLTKEEEIKIDELKENFSALLKAEKNITASELNKNKELTTILSTIDDNLYELSKIQLKEGKQEMSVSKLVINEVELFTQIEIYLLIFLGILVQFVVIYNPKPKDS
jgi:hypothetical protein